MRDLWKSGVSGELRYFGASGEAFFPNMRPENPTTQPALSVIGNMMQLRNLSLMLPRALRCPAPASSVNDKFRNRIMFPITDSAGCVVGFSGRIFGKNASPEAPKYLNSPDTPLFHKSRILYGFDKAKLSIRKHN